MKIETETLEPLAHRRRIREERQRTEAEGFREDVAILCRCPNCGVEHYRRRDTESIEKVK